MPKIRVLVVDDAVVFRRMVSEELNRDPDLEVVGTAANGRVALARLAQLNPDVVILDIEMPEMDGLATLTEIRKTHPRLPVIMFSALTERGGEATLNALALGATDYFTKPANSTSIEASLAVLREHLVPEIKALCGKKKKASGPISTRKVPDTFVAPRSAPRVLAIGTSTGGPNALAELFRGLPRHLPVPIVIVQHMPPMFTRLLAERLSAEFPIRFREGVSGEVLQPGHAWIAPGDYHMRVVRAGREVRVQLDQDPPENSCRPAVDVLFRSIAEAYGAGTLAVILTGMGQDGLRGSEAIHEAGGQILAQDEATSVVWGMPGAVVRAGLADRVIPLALLADEITRRIQADSSQRKP